MGREILFRGKRTDNGEWVYGNYCYAELIDKSGYEDLIIEQPADGETRRVIPETVGQYIGLSDKNGTKIFEGDILKCCDDKIGFEFMAIAEFGNPNGTYSWGWQLKPISGDTFVNPDILLWVETEETGSICEVIGNIHDNPKLLEVSE